MARVAGLARAAAFLWLVGISPLSASGVNHATSALLQLERPRELFTSSSKSKTERPVLGVLSQPTPAEASAGGESYIAASYVKFLESGGARVVPIIYNDPWEKNLQKLKSINGLLLPGGSANKSGPLLRAVNRLLQAAVAFNDAGDYFPLFAECLSLEMLAMVISRRGRDILGEVPAFQPSTLHFVGDWAKSRNMFAWMAQSLVEQLQTEELVTQHHQYGVSVGVLEQDPDLSAFFTVLTTSTDEAGKEYVSTMEAKAYPITATQWHPEKATYEWGLPSIPHSIHAVQVTSAAAIFFVQ